QRHDTKTTMTYRPKQRKALWYRAKFGDTPALKPRKPMARRTCRVKPRSRRTASIMREYVRKATAWKGGRLCCCIGLRDGQGEPICRRQSHLCDDVHHSRGKAGPLLMDDR